jgi:hypothetical protein
VAADDDVDAVLAAIGHSPDDEAAAASAESRSRRRWLRQQAAESSTMAGVLLTLAERPDPVTLRCGPWRQRGRLARVTAAVVMLDGPEGIVVFPTDSITAVEAPSPVADDRTPAGGPDLAGVLAMLAPDRPAVRLLLGDGTEVVGTLTEVGKDVAVVRLTSSVATIRLSALAGVVLLARGNSDPAGSA